MSQEAKQKVNRLLNMIVEEVSLVDRAANNKRFLIVKRDSDMSEHDEKDKEQLQEETVGNEKESEESKKESQEGKKPQAPSEPVNLAINALEAVTNTIEQLNLLDDDDAKVQVKELSEKLASISQTLLSSVTAQDEGDKNDPAEDPSKDEDLKQTLDEVRASLQALADFTQSQTDATQTDSGNEGNAEESNTNLNSGAMEESLSKLTSQVETMVKMSQEQNKRLARLEKRFGLPNSRPAGEKQRLSKQQDEVSWPLDLNRGTDRESVDKSVSFHDV